MKRVVAGVLGVAAAVAASSAWAGQPAAPENRDWAFVTIYEALRGRSAMYAQFTRLSGGDLLCAFRDSQMGPDAQGRASPWSVPGSRILCVRSPDEGRTWSTTPVFIFQDKEGFAYTNQSGLGHQAKDGSILVPFYVCNDIANREDFESPLHQIRSYMARSRDDGRTWACEELTSPFFSNWLNGGGICRLADGSLWMMPGAAGYQLSLAKAKEMGEKGQKRERRCQRLLESTDDGKSWRHYAYIGYDPTHAKETAHFPDMHEPTLVQLPSGKVLMMTRPFMHKWTSLDRGRTWSVEESTLSRIKDPKEGTAGICPSMAYTKAGPPTGTLVLVYHSRWGAHGTKGGNYISFSHDEGETWGHPTFLDGGAYPCLYELRPDTGAFLCGYYLHSSLLKGVFFSVPFPTGIRASPGGGNAGRPSIIVQWDPYAGKDSQHYEYRVYRSTQPGFRLEDAKLVCSTRDARRPCTDNDVKKGQTYYYRAAACRDGRIVSRSWEASATADYFFGKE
jgi:hypothetical protein